jgi:hypothetical protein
VSDDLDRINIEMCVSGPVFAHAVMHFNGRFDPAPFTDEEQALGRAVRFIFISDDEAWRYSTCLDCDLPLPFHPSGRRKRSKPRYCAVAQKRMLAALDRRPEVQT